jgi:hypothetical protein
VATAWSEPYFVTVIETEHGWIMDGVPAPTEAAARAEAIDILAGIVLPDLNSSSPILPARRVQVIDLLGMTNRPPKPVVLNNVALRSVRLDESP